MKTINIFGVMAVLMTGWMSSALALPYLQLDISPGTYNTTTEDTVATSNPFTLYGLIDTGNNSDYLVSDDFTISIALLGLQSGQTDFGSFDFGGTTFSDISQFTFGTPPDPTGDLATHGIYETWFAEVLFNLDPNNLDLVTAYDVQTNVGDPVANPNGTLALISALVDISGLNEGLTLHFDFYTTKVEQVPGTGTPNKPAEFRTVIDKFAPFSHDATSCIAGDDNCDGGGIIIEVPEPAMSALMGIGLLALAFAYSRKAAS